MHFSCDDQTIGKIVTITAKSIVKLIAEYFGEQCMEYGLYNSVRNSFYSSNKEREEITFKEHQMKRCGKLSFNE